MKKVLIIYLGSRGGGAVDTFEIASALSRVGKHSYSLIISQNNSLSSQYKNLNLNKLYIVKTFKRNIISLILNTLALFNLVRILAVIVREKPNILLFTMSHPWNFIVSLFSKMILRDIKVIYIVHNPIDFEAVGRGLYDKIIYLLENLMIRLSDRLITLSKVTANSIINHLKIDQSKIKLLRLGSHSSLFSGKFAHQGFNLEGKLRLLFFGRILNYKGIDILIRAYDLMVKKGMNVELTVAGEGRIEDWILREIRRLNINLINRWITEDELLEILKRTDIVVAPYKEASQSGPISIATALGIPVIATKVGGLVEQVLDGINGILIEPEDSETLCEAVERVYYDRNLLIKLSEGAKFLSRSQFSWDNIVKEMEEIWE